MDQVKQVGHFIWKYRFWFGIGLSVILASFLYFSAATALLAEAQQKKNQLEKIYSDVDGFRNKADAPNPRWETKASEIEAELAKTVDGVWVKLYRQQENLFTWPAEVSKQFSHRPFGADLSDNRNRYLTDYRFAYPNQLDDLWLIVNPIRRNEEGKVVGIVEYRKEQIPRAVWNGPVRSMEAWLAQEQLWVNRAILLAIAKANKGRQSWREALIRRINDIRIGEAALDSKTIASSAAMINAMENVGEEKHKTLATAKQENSGYQPIRYLTKNEQFREIPVFVSLMVDQERATPVLAALSDADLGFVIHQSSLYVPHDKIEIPLLLRADGKSGKSSERNDPIFNSMQLDVWGRVRLYEMPPSLKEEFQKKMEAEAAKTEGGASGGGATKSAEPGAAEGKETPKAEETKSETPKASPAGGEAEAKPESKAASKDQPAGGADAAKHAAASEDSKATPKSDDNKSKSETKDQN